MVEAQRRVEALDVDAHRLARRVRFGEELRQQHAAQPAAAVFRQQADVDDAHLVLPARHVETAARLAVDLDDLEAGAGVVLLVPGVLRLELLAHERLLLLRRPVDAGELLLARAGVEAEEERQIRVRDRAQPQRLGNVQS